jgi:hypothetical protein
MTLNPKRLNIVEHKVRRKPAGTQKENGGR